MEVKYILNGIYKAPGSPKILPRIGEKVRAGFLPEVCRVVDIIHDLNTGIIVVYLSF